MKSQIAALLLLSAISSHASVTLGFSTGSNAAEGWATRSGDKTMTMVWGILVDTAGDGFDGFVTTTSQASDGGILLAGGESYQGGFSLTSTTTLPGGQLLSLLGGQVTDDRLFISSNLMALVAGDVRITQLTNFVYDANMGAGDKYAIVWFQTSVLGSVHATGGLWGAWYKDGATPSTGTVLPADPGSYTVAATGPAGMFGPDGAASTKPALLGFPEPSTLMLGLLGATSLLRRRR